MPLPAAGLDTSGGWLSFPAKIVPLLYGGLQAHGARRWTKPEFEHPEAFGESREEQQPGTWGFKVLFYPRVLL